MCIGGRRTALGAVAAHFQARDQDMETAIALNLAFEPIEQDTLEFRNAAAPQARHVDMVTLGSSFVEVLFAFHVHVVKFIYQAMALEQAERPVNRDAIDMRVDFARPP